MNANYDSLDEELLFDAVGGAVDGGPWLLMGHTHSPLLQPLSRTGVRWMRYANSGHGLWEGMITAIEWEGSLGRPFQPKVVAWVRLDRDDDLGREAFLPDDAVVVVGTDGTTVARVELVASGDGVATGGRRSATGVTEAAVAAVGVVELVDLAEHDVLDRAGPRAGRCDRRGGPRRARSGSVLTSSTLQLVAVAAVDEARAC